MNRRDLIKMVAARAAMAAVPVGAALAASSPAAQSRSSGAETIMLRNAAFELALTPGKGVQCRMVHRASGVLLADALYSYSFGFPALAIARKSSQTVILRGETEATKSAEDRAVCREYARDKP